jgi:membrane-associated PAP2 superfamily phosphatase
LRRRLLVQAGILAAGAVLIVLVFGVGGADARLAGLAFDPVQGRFPLKDAWLLAVAGHEWLKWAALGAWLGCLAAREPFRRGALYMLAIVAITELLKSASPWSCPWDLPQYGGSQPETGKCLPAAHPLTGFAFFGLYPALRDARPRAARAALAAAWIVGLAAGAIQMARGAHFASHVLWTAWVAWGTTLLLSALPKRRA